MKTCKQCRYFDMLKDKEGKEVGFGVCISLPPSIVVHENQIQSVHPQVSEKRLPCTLFREVGGKKLLS